MALLHSSAPLATVGQQCLDAGAAGASSVVVPCLGLRYPVVGARAVAQGTSLVSKAVHRQLPRLLAPHRGRWPV